MLKKLAVLMCLYAAGSMAQVASAVPDEWKPLQFLIGTWEARTSGGSAQAASSGTYSFQFELGNHVIVRQISKGGCKGPADFDCGHNDLLYIYRENSQPTPKAIYFDSEGHVIHYDLSIPAPTSVVFLSDSSQPGPQFRLSYDLKGTTMYGKFEIRMPGETQFKPYLEWSGGKAVAHKNNSPH